MRNPTLFTILYSLFLISFLLPLASPSPASSLSRRSSLAVEDDSAVLLSPDKSFTCGFYKVGSNAYAFSIWFSNSTNKTVAWTANRDRPVNGHGSRITLRKDGAMVLTDYDGEVVWSTDTSSTQAFQAQLLNTGNLVVINPDGNVLWQSFDSPTDTLLPTQAFTRNMTLISAATNGVLTSGHPQWRKDIRRYPHNSVDSLAKSCKRLLRSSRRSLGGEAQGWFTRGSWMMRE